MSTPIKAFFLGCALSLLFHWLTAGQDNIIEGPPETPDMSSFSPSQP